MEKIIKFNRTTLESVDNFITDTQYNNSRDLYGLPKRVYHLINKPLNNDITYVDLLIFLSEYLNKKNLNYLEIGVSVLKTFYQVASYLQDSTLYAYDINIINPTIESRFIKNGDNYNYKTNKIVYYKGDIYDEKSLLNFRTNIVEKKIDIIFSDAHHRYPGLLSEYTNLIQYILNDNFILYYDDLAWSNDMHTNMDSESTRSNMTGAFFFNANKLKQKYDNLTVALLSINGWLGNHERKHTNGIVTTLNLKKILEEQNININIKYF